MWCSLRVASRFRTRGARLPAAAAAAAAVGAATAAASPWFVGQFGVISAQADASIGTNRPLAPRHRVALCGWPIKGARQSSDPRVATLRSLFDHCREAGYDGIEMGCDDLKEMGFFPWSMPNHEVAAAVQREAAAARFPSTSRRGPSTGVLYKVTDGNPAPFPGCLDFSDPRFEEAYKQKLRDDKNIGAEYVTFQIFLPPRYLNSAGAYRDDSTYLEQCAQRIAVLQRIAFSEGMNCYVETHIDRISEDLQAFCEILDRCASLGCAIELNGDLSHYYYRGISQGSCLPIVLGKIGHMHQRMCRQHGDLSANVRDNDPAADWDAKGVTWQAFEYAKPALAGGLSSRVIMGESGPMHLVEDALGLDAKLVPLWRAMARYADEQIGEVSAREEGEGQDKGPSPVDESELSAAEADLILAAHFSTRRHT